MTKEELTKLYLEIEATIQAEETLNRDLLTVEKICRFRQDVYSQALPAAEAGRTIELLDTAALITKVVATTIAVACVGAWAVPALIEYFGASSAVAWTGTKLGLTITVGSKAVPLISTTVGATLVGTLVTPPLTGLRWPTMWPNVGPLAGSRGQYIPVLDHSPNNFKMVAGREQHADEGSSLVGLFFKCHYYYVLGNVLKNIDDSFMTQAREACGPCGVWPGWEKAKIVASLIQDDQTFICGLDTAVYRQIANTGSKPGKVYLEKVKTCLAFWKTLYNVVVDRRMQILGCTAAYGAGTLPVHYALRAHYRKLLESAR